VTGEFKTDLACRNCKSKDFLTTEQGILAPFFLKRVHGLELIDLAQILKLKSQKLNNYYLTKLLLFLLKIAKQLPVLSRILKFSGARTRIRVCKTCYFVGPEADYDISGQLNNLYLDYRSERYNIERAHFEPNYRNISNLISSDNVISQRNENLNSILKANIDVDQIKNVIDWGGGKGEYIPEVLQNKKIWLLDISNEPTIKETYIRVSSPPTEIQFDYVQVCHVLEHVASPFQFMSIVLKHVRPGGYVYIEVPQDRSNADLAELLNSNSEYFHHIHEHLNLYSETAIGKLADALDLEIIKIQSKRFDFDWVKSDIISAVLQKKTN
jgi:2-polyprenyl-3-methyl-5-hydroxy-6-metoxy-1,4-benzoquinol methylase